MQMFYYGIVEDRQDPMRLGRVRVRVVGLHTPDISLLQTADLPWAWPIQDVTSGALSGIGRSATGLVEGSTVVIYFADDSMQIPMVVGSLAGIPSGTNEVIEVNLKSPLQELAAITPPTKAPTAAKYIGQLTTPQVDSIKAELKKRESGSMGNYIFTAKMLESLGYIIKGSFNRERDDAKVFANQSYWTKKDSINSIDDFKNNTTIQDSILDTLLKQDYTDMCRTDTVSANTPPEKLAGMLMVSHLLGTTGASDYLKNGQNDSSHSVTAEQYYMIGYSVISGRAVSEAPTPENINKPFGQNNVVADTGFIDPNGKYPLSSHIGEPDTPRLASVQNIAQTIVGEKETSRVQGIPVANSATTWEQSPIPYNAKYPFNQVFQSESGHVLEFDDTAGSERINIHHSKGSFIEFDSYGNRVDRVKGIRTVIVDADDLVYIQGSGHVSIVGDMSVRVGGQCQVEIIGDCNLKVNGNMTQEVVGDYSIKAKSFTVQADQNAGIKAGAVMAVDGASLALNAGASQTAKTVSQYSPTITIPAPVTRDEEMGFNMEDDTSPEAVAVNAAQTASSAPAQKNQSDTSAPSKLVGKKLVCDFGQIKNSTVLLDSSLSGASGVVKTWTVSELCKDGSFAFNGQNGLTAQQIACNLRHLVANVIEPLRIKYSSQGFKINSCFRPTKNGKSQHEIGCAVDIGFSKIRGQKDDRKQYFAIAQQIKNSVPFDQLLLEYRSNGSVWIHISYVQSGNRYQVLTLNNDKVIGQGLIELSQA